MKKIYTVTVDGVQHQYPEGTPYQDIAGEVQSAYSNDILLVERDGRLCELGKQLDRDCTLKMITIQDKPGMQTYERSAIFLMLKAFYDIVGSEHIERICVEYSLSHALFITAQGGLPAGPVAAGTGRVPYEGIGIAGTSHSEAFHPHR